MTMQRRDAGVLLVLGAALCWGTTGTAQAFAPAGASSLSVGAVRLLVGGLALLFFAAGQGLLSRWRELPFWPTWLAAAALAGYQLTFFAGVRRTGVAVGTILAIASAPILAGGLSLLLGWPPGRRWLVATLLAVVGCTLLVLGGGELQAQPLGMALAVSAGGCYALYTLFLVRMIARAPADLAAAAAFALGAVMLLPVLFLSDVGWLFTLRGAAVAAELGLVATAFAYVLYARALQWIPMSTAVTLALGEPMMASLLGVLLLGERLTLIAWGGVLLILVGLMYLTVARDAAQPAQEARAKELHV